MDYPGSRYETQQYHWHNHSVENELLRIIHGAHSARGRQHQTSSSEHTAGVPGTWLGTESYGITQLVSKPKSARTANRCGVSGTQNLQVAAFVAHIWSATEGPESPVAEHPAAWTRPWHIKSPYMQGRSAWRLSHTVAGLDPYCPRPINTLATTSAICTHNNSA